MFLARSMLASECRCGQTARAARCGGCHAPVVPETSRAQRSARACTCRHRWRPAARLVCGARFRRRGGGYAHEEADGGSSRDQHRCGAPLRCTGPRADGRRAERAQQYDARPRARRDRYRDRQGRSDPHDRLSDRRGGRRESHRRPRPQLPRTRAGLRSRNRPRAGENDGSPQYRARAARQLGQARRPRAGADRRLGRHSGHRAGLCRVAAAVLRELGIHAGRGDLHEPANDRLERCGARGPQGHDRRCRLARRARGDGGGSEAARQHVRADRCVEADPRGHGEDRTPQGSAAAVARTRCGRGVRPADRLARVARRSRRHGGRAQRRHHPRRRQRFGKIAVRLLPEALEPHECGRRHQASRAPGCRHPRYPSEVDRPRRLLPAGDDVLPTKNASAASGADARAALHVFRQG